MAMTKLIKEVKKCVVSEYHRAGVKFGFTNHSDHESYAVILEEFEEAKFEAESFERVLNDFWYAVKRNVSPSDKLSVCRKLEVTALLCACEMIQVAAMAKKAYATIRDQGSSKEFRREECSK